MNSRTAMGFALSLFCSPVASAQNVVKYHTTMNDVKYTYNSTSSPVARLAPGDILETNTVDAFGNAIQKPGDTLALGKGGNPVSGGNTLYLPVNVPGALLYMGDGHAAMGDGEVAGTAVEVPLRVRLRVSVIKGKKIDWPRFENIDEIMAAGIYRPLDDSLRIAFTQLIGWIHADYGLSELDAYELLSKVAKIHVTQMVDPNYVVIAKIDKKYLPPKRH